MKPTLTQAEAELSRLWKEKPSMFWQPCGKVEQFLNSIDTAAWKEGDLKFFILRSGTQAGKTTTALNLLNYLAKPYPHKWLGQSNYLKNFPRPNVGRVYTTLNAAKTTYLDGVRRWFPCKEHIASKAGGTYDSFFMWSNGSRFDIFSTEKDVQQGESTTLNYAIMDEPFSPVFWNGLISRFPMGGIIFIVMTAVEGAGWIQTELETPDRIGKDVFVTVMDAEDCCIEHGVRGYRPHAYIDNMMRSMSEEDAYARLHGGYLSLSGAVFKGYFDVKTHTLSKIPARYAGDWANKNFRLVTVIDPHLRKPFALGFYSVFRNGDAICVGEFPDERYSMFHKMVSLPGTEISDYCEIIKKFYEEIFGEKFKTCKHKGKFIMDPNAAMSPYKMGGFTVKHKFYECLEETNFFLPSDKIDDGHIAVKEMLGFPSKGVSPRIYFMDYCRNHIFAMINYAYKEQVSKTRGISERPELIYKDFADLVRYLAVSNVSKAGLDEPLIIAPYEFTPHVGGYQGV